MKIINEDNLRTLNRMVVNKEKFDLIEIDGPYMAGLENWDNLSEDEYIEHYARRLVLIRDLLKPWGCVFLFGYPEGCAEIKAWATRTGILKLRRWITWYKRMTVHKGRKVETILFFLQGKEDKSDLLKEFGLMLKGERQKRGLTLRQLGEMADRPWWHRGGNLYFETGSGGPLSLKDFLFLRDLFDFDPDSWWGVVERSFEDVTDLDFISKTYNEKTSDLNDVGLRSKPVGLYLDLFSPLDTGLPNKTALVVYGGSGNAGIAAEALGYETTLIELNQDRCKALEDTYQKRVESWKHETEYEPGSLRPSRIQVEQNPDQISFWELTE